MRKIYSLALMAVMLLVSANGWAKDIVSVTNGSAEKMYGTLEEALTAVGAVTSMTASASVAEGFDLQKPFTIKMLDNYSWNDNSDIVYLQDKQEITLDLNGFSVSGKARVDGKSTKSFQITLSGAHVTVTNTSSDKVGKIELTASKGVGESIFDLFGSSDKYAKNYSVLDVEGNVELSSTNTYVISINTTSSADPIRKNSAYGAVVNVSGKTYIKSSYGICTSGNIKVYESGISVPQINIDGVEMHDDGNGANLYLAGYVDVTIKNSKLYGSHCIYMKGGNLTIVDSYLEATGAYQEVKPNGNGSTGGDGTAIVMDSHINYTEGGLSLNISGAETYIKGTNGYAIYELSSTNTESKTKPEDFKISGGTFEGAKGALNTTATLEEGVKIKGGITGGTYSSDISGYLKDVKGTITVIKDKNGNDLYTVSDTEGVTWVATLAGATKDSYVRLEGKNESVSTDLEIAYLKVLSGSTVTVEKSLTVGGVIIDEKSKLIVKPGAKLVVLTQGIVAFHEANLVLETQEGKEAILLLSPAVTGNTHPYAMVEFATVSHRPVQDGVTLNIFQRFGVPTMNLTSIQAEGNVPTAMYSLNYSLGDWEMLGILNGDPALDIAKLNVPFNYYQMLSNTPTQNTKYTMAGQLYGNAATSINVHGRSWNGYANSYTGLMDIKSMLNAFMDQSEELDPTVYSYVQAGPTTHYTWEAVNFAYLDRDPKIVSIQPMQAFLLNNEEGTNTTLSIKYDDLVWNPAHNTRSAAPARHNSSLDNACADVVITSMTGETDHVLLVESDQFSSEFDRGYDAVKFMNDNMNLYVSDIKNMAILATNDLSDTYLGFSCVEAGTYTISFDRLSGEALSLIDLVNGNVVDMTADNTYTFTAEANTMNSNRFLIRKASKVVTNVEDVQNAVKAMGIYSITGQYLGEIGEWNNMPQGMYIVNGEKKIK